MASLDLRAQLNLQLLLNHEEQSLFGEERRVFLRKLSGESMRHVTMKVLGYLVFYRAALEIERSVGQHYKPDLVELDGRGLPRLWIDCGTTKVRKLEKIVQANRTTHFVIIKPTMFEVRRYAECARPRIARGARVDFLGFPSGYVSRLADQLRGRHELVATVTGGLDHLYLSVDGTSFDTRLLFV